MIVERDIVCSLTSFVGSSSKGWASMQVKGEVLSFDLFLWVL